MAKRSARAAARNARTALKNTTRTYDEDVDDEAMPDAPAEEAVTSPAAAEDEEIVEEEEGTPAQDSDAPSEPATPAPDEHVRSKRRLGRPPKNKSAGWDSTDERGNTSEQGTPVKRGKGRGGFRGGGRWAKRGGPLHVTQQPIDKEGNMVDVIDDELQLPEDVDGESKVDKLGYLQGDREYRCRTFTVTGRGKRLYMLSTEPARCVGFRDSYLFFTKHKRLYKIITDDDEKRDLIDRALIPHSYKGRPIGIVTARSVFREFGARIVVGGKRVIDDYEVAAARADGVVEGELADPDDIFKQGEAYNRNQYVAWHGASAVYHTGQPTVPIQAGKAAAGQKKRVMINDINWMFEHARSSSQFNAALVLQRRRNLQGIYDPHTNVMQYPKIMQPSHARWEQVHDQESIAMGSTIDHEQPTIFQPVKAIYSRNFTVIDTLLESPGGPWGVPGPDGDAHDLGFNGLSAVSDRVRAELPLECRAAFSRALDHELQWKQKWTTESRDGSRVHPPIDKGQF